MGNGVEFGPALSAVDHIGIVKEPVATKEGPGAGVSKATSLNPEARYVRPSAA